MKSNSRHFILTVLTSFRFLFGFFIAVLLFQNCSEPPNSQFQFNSERSSTTGPIVLDANGAGYGGKLVLTTPSSVGPNARVNEPQEIAVDDDGNYFVVSDQHFIVAISKDQKILYRKGGYSKTARDMFDGISGISVVGDQLFVASCEMKKIKVFDKYSLTYLYEFTLKDQNGAIVCPLQLSASKQSLYAATEKSGFFIFDFNGKQKGQIKKFPNAKVQPPSILMTGHGMTVSKNDVMYFKDINWKVYRYDVINDVLESSIEVEPNKVQSMTVSDSDIVYLNYGNTVTYFKGSTWEKLGSFGASGMMPGSFNGIMALEVDGNFIYVADYYNQRIQKISISLFWQRDGV